MIKKLTLLSLCVLAFYMVGFVGITRAEDDKGAGIIVSPPLTEKTAETGTTITGSIKITNSNASSELVVDVTTEDFIAKGEDGQQTFVDPETNTGKYSLAKWIEVEKNFTVPANDSKQVPYSITVPSDAEPGGHYGVIFFSPSIVSDAAAGGVTAIPKVGALMLITVPGEVRYSGNIIEFSTKKLFIDSSNKVDFITRFQNTGSVHVKPTGSIEIKNMLGKSVAKSTVNEKLGNVLPDSIRKFDNNWTSKHGFGLYNTNVTLTYADGKTATSTLSFWIIPWKETAGGIVLLIILIWIMRHLSWRRAGKPEKQEKPKKHKKHKK
ncbi:MAG: hypothetical protein NTW60_01075 [Candidatus Wolfebacteria bacterium]|nr:hypothetical protein [Candidatus Wolfebacteria bacterium]